MPEINLFLFDLAYLFKLFPNRDKDFEREIADYEQQTNENMAQIRINLFSAS